MKKRIFILLCFFSWLSSYGQSHSKKAMKVILQETFPLKDFFIKVKYKTDKSAVYSKIYHNQLVYGSFYDRGFSLKEYIDSMANVLSDSDTLLLKDSSDALIYSDIGEVISNRLNQFVDSILTLHNGDGTVFFDSTNVIKDEYRYNAAEIAYALWDEGIYIKGLKSNDPGQRFGIGLIDPLSKSKYLDKYKALIKRPFISTYRALTKFKYKPPVYIKLSDADSISTSLIMRDSTFKKKYNDENGNTITYTSFHYDKKGTFNFEKKINDKMVVKGNYKANGKKYKGIKVYLADIFFEIIKHPYYYYLPRKSGQWEYFDEQGKLIKVENFDK